MKKISGLIGKKTVVAVALVAILIGAGAYTLAVSSGDKAPAAPEKIIVTQGPAASIDYRVYDLFQEPWGEWWADRWTYYSTDMIITSGAGWNTALFLPSRTPQTAYQGLIYAPYRYSIDAVDAEKLNISNPEFLPVLGPSIIGTSQASLSVYFQYLYETWWNDYWIATWGGDADWVGDAFYSPGTTDGYYLGTTYSVTMNRDAASSWINLPVGSNVATWWAANKESTENDFDSWISDEGNNRLDIYCGYEWTYDIFGTYMDLVDLGAAGVRLDIAHISWGYEILMTRWLTEIDLSPGLEPWYEDFSLTVDYGVSASDLLSDAVCQYNMHAVKANGTADGAAWVWEPAQVDYVTKMNHPSDYQLYSNLKYTSWNAGDTMLGTYVPYEQSPGIFNLPAASTLTIELPTVDVPAYQGVALPEIAYDDLAVGDNSGFLAIQDNGQIGLGYWKTNHPTSVNITEMYDPVARTLTLEGPMTFSDLQHPNGAVYHGIPWIEFWVDHNNPTANAGADKNNVVTETPVSFDGNLSSDDVRVFNWTWTFDHMGSPTTLYGPAPDFSFMALGDYTVTLTVMDSVGNTATDQVVVHVTILIPEFPMVLLPIAATLALIAVFKKRKR